MNVSGCRRAAAVTLAAAFLTSVRPSHAQSSTAGAGATGCAQAGTADADADRDPPVCGGMPGWELADWKDPRTGSTSQFANGCSAVVELRLTGVGQRNLLYLSISNRHSGAISFDANRATVEFQNGVTRRLIAPAGDATIPKNANLSTVLLFPEKEEFRAQDRMQINLPMGPEGQPNCIVRADLRRPTGVEPEAATYVKYTNLEYYLAGGVRVATAGGPAVLGGNGGAAAELGFGFFFNIHHGFFFDIVIDDYGTRGLAAAGSDLALVGEGRISAGGFFPGYTFRLYPLPWLTVAYGAAISPYIFELGDDSEGGSRRTSAPFSFRERLRVAARLFSLPSGTGVALAPTLVHTFVPYGTLGPVELRGSAVTAMLQLYIDM